MKLVWFIPFAFVLAVESILKGWYSLILVPLLVVALPLVIGLGVPTKRLLARGHHPWLVALQAIQIVGALLTYICTPGFGDTEDTLLFGFYSSTTESTISNVSYWFAVIGFFALCAATVLQIVYVVVAYRKLKQMKASSQSPTTVS